MLSVNRLSVVLLEVVAHIYWLEMGKVDSQLLILYRTLEWNLQKNCHGREVFLKGKAQYSSPPELTSLHQLLFY
jgi:hypothetical protein